MNDTLPLRDDPEDQEAFDRFQVRCRSCGSLHVEWFNDMGFSCESGGWGSAGFCCRYCGIKTEMITS